MDPNFNPEINQQLPAGGAPLQPAASSTPPPRKPRRPGWLVPVVVLVLLLIGAGTWAAITLGGKPKTTTASPTTSPQPGLSQAEQQALGSKTADNNSILNVTQIIADQADLGDLLVKALQVSTKATIGGDLTVDGNGTFGGLLTAANFSGNGAAITGVDASLLGGHNSAFFTNAQNLQGTIADSLLSGNVALRNAANTFTSANTFSGGLNSTGSFSATGATSLGGTTISSLSLGAPLGVGSGGTGVSSVPAASILFGQGTATLGVATPGSAGLCLLSGSSDVQWGACSGAGGVASLDGLTGALTINNTAGAGSAITIDDATTAAKGIASFNATNFSAAGGVVNTIQGIAATSAPTFAGLTLSSALTVGNGGTGLSTLSANQLLFASTSSAISQFSNGAGGDCLVSNGAGAAPSFQTCTGAGGVASLDGLTGALTINNTAGAGSAITIDDATTAAKGIASFNSTNFSVAAGIVNTIQGIAASSAPTFAGLTLSSALTVANGGTGASSLAANGVLLGNGASPVTAVTGSLGQCLVATAGAPVFQACPGSGGVTSVEGQTGVVTVNNSTGSGGAITIDNAKADDGTTPGIASFSSTSFSDNGAGVIDTIQDISVTATPAFGGLTLSTALTTANGGTGAASFTADGVLFGNGAGALQVTSAGTGGQVLLANGSGVPTFTTLSGDLTVNNAGVTTIGNAKVTNAKLANSSLTVTAGSGLAGGGLVSLGGSSASLSVNYGQLGRHRRPGQHHAGLPQRHRQSERRR